MKKKILLTLAVASLLSFGSLVGCDKGSSNPGPSSTGSTQVGPTSSGQTTSGDTGGGSTQISDFSFSVALSTGSKNMNKGDVANIVITETNPSGIQTKYSYSSSNTGVITVSDTGVVTAVAKGSANITVTESTSKSRKVLALTVTEAVLANGGYNYASLGGAEAIQKRTEILGKLEQNAMDNHLTGITLFENGGYVKYAQGVTLPTTEYITGYGFGLLGEGSIDTPLATEQNEDYKMYLHSATSSDPAKINARNDTGSQVSDLESYITLSFWGTKMNKTKNGYVWYPVLAKDKVTFNGVSQDFTRPVPIFSENGVEREVKPNEDPNPLGLYKTWRIYVKTNEVKYRYAGTPWNGKDFDKRAVALADYEFAYRFLLTGANGQKRGTEMAADQTYGIVGAQAFNTRTKTLSDDDSKALWQDMQRAGKLGIKTGTDSVNGDYIQVTILNAIDRFTAMYTLSSNLLSPMPEEFIEAIGGGKSESNPNPIAKGAKRYGTFGDLQPGAAHYNDILDFTISVGPYMLEKWYEGQNIIFKRNDTWTESGRYNIAGVKLVVIDATTDSDAIYREFNAGKLHSCGIPTKHISEEKGQARVYKTRGDSTFKLNVNSCNQTTWDDLFGTTGKINKGSDWDVKPWMSNDNFLKGLFYSIDRKTFADNRGVNPSINYFADSYLSDPENGVSYNDSDAHKAAVSAYEVFDSEGNSLYGYSHDKAVLAFKTAVKELVKTGDITKGTKSSPTKITIHIRWMYQTDIKEYGDEIKGYFEGAFNDPEVCDNTVKLEVKQDAVDVWDQVYNEYMMKGQFDLAFGAISGNTYNPLNFLEVLKSDNSSGFTLNWGTDTSKVNENKPLVYDDKIWSFDALWAAADHGCIVENGRPIKSVKKAYMKYSTNNFYDGTTFTVPVNFFQDTNDTVKFEITRVSIYIVGDREVDLPFTLDENGDPKIVLAQGDKDTEGTARYINQLIIDKFKLMDPKKDEKDWIRDPFKVDNYGIYWSIVVYYTFSIKDPATGKWGTPSETYQDVAKNADAWIDN